MDSMWTELARNIPAAAAVIFTIYIMSHYEERREQRREQNAKDKANEDREHEIKMQEMWSASLNLMNGKTDETFKLIAEMLDNHEKASADRYQKMGITQELIKITKKHLQQEAT